MTLEQSGTLCPKTQQQDMTHSVGVTPELDQDDTMPNANHETATTKLGKKGETYGSFLIDGTEFAIPVSVVQEVVNEPDKVSPLPLAPTYMPGLFNLRGTIIPIIDLRKLLEFPAAEVSQSHKVAIIEHGEHCIGLLFDKTGEILSEDSAARVKFRSDKNGVKDTVIKGVLKFDNGDRLVQILDPVELLNLERVPRADNKYEEKASRSAKGRRRTSISFQTGHTSCAIDLRYVKEVREMPRVEKSLFSHGFEIGPVNLRGTMLPVLDFRGFLGDKAVLNLETAVPQERKILVIETPEGPIGLMVFSIDSILSYYTDDIMPFAKLALPRGDLVSGCLIDEDSNIVMMLEPQKLMNEPAFVAAAKASQEIYSHENAASTVETQNTSTARRTFIQFTIEKRFALDIADVSEVLNRPEELLEPPFSLSFVEGIINLRGELITLLNPRVLYGMSTGRGEGEKVLIFKHNGQKLGILVDSVDEIILARQRDVIEHKPLGQQNLARDIIKDVTGSLHHTMSDGRRASIMIMNAEALIERCLRASE